MNNLQKYVALTTLASQQQIADTLHQEDYSKRPYIAFQTARSVLRTLARALSDESDIAEAILKLTGTLDDAFCK